MEFGTSLARSKSNSAMNQTFKIALVGALCALPAVAVACSCAPPPAPKIALEKSAAVFVGRVISVETSDFSNKYQFSVSKQWKGIKGKTTSIVTANNSAACGINFDSDRDYLVYAFKNDDNQLRTNLCSRTKRAADAATDLAELGAPQTDVAAYLVDDKGEVQLNVTRNLGSIERPEAVLSKALEADKKSQRFRLNWNSPVNAIRGSALYNRANSTFKIYSRSQNDTQVEVRSTLFSGVTDEFFKQVSLILSDGENSLPAGVTKKDLGSKTVQIRSPRVIAPR